MSDAHNNEPNSYTGNVSSFETSSQETSINSITSKYAIEHERARKLEDKLAGYRTVAQQLPKVQQALAEYQKREEQHGKQLADCKHTVEEQQQRILYLEGLIQNTTVLSDLDINSPRTSPGQTQSSPSFEIIGNTPPSKSSPKQLAPRQLGKANSFSFIDIFGTSQPEPHRAGSSIQQQSEPSQRTSSSQQQSEPSQRSSSSQQQSEPSQRTSSSQQQSEPSQRTPSSQQQQQWPTGVEESSHGLANPVQPAPGPSPDLSAPASAASGQLSVVTNLKSVPVTQTDTVANHPVATHNQTDRQKVEDTSNKQFNEISNKQVSIDTSDKPMFSIISIKSKSDVSTRQLPEQGAVQPANSYSALSYLGADHRVSQPATFYSPNLSNRTNIHNSGTLSSTNVLPVTAGSLKQGDTNQLIRSLLSPRPAGDSLIAASFWPIGSTAGGGPVTTPLKEAGQRFNHQIGSHEASSTSPLHVSGTVQQPSINRATSEDLMLFSSLGGKNQWQGLAARQNSRRPRPPFPTMATTEEPSYFTKEAANILAQLRGNNSSLLVSDMLVQFADVARNMEAELKQHKVRCLSVPDLEDENARLREAVSTLTRENETLLEFMKTQKPDRDQGAGWGLSPPGAGWTSTQENRDPFRGQFLESSMAKKMLALSTMNAKLFQVNKEWHSNWESLQNKLQEERAQLQARIQTLEADNRNLGDNNSVLGQEVTRLNAQVQDLLKVQEEDKAGWLRQQEQLRSELRDLRHSKKLAESHLAALKLDASRGGRHIGSREENVLLKQQLTIFAEDFDKEKRDRIEAEKKCEKFRKERDQTRQILEQKLNKVLVQLRTQESDLRAKARQNADLIYQVDELKLKLQHEQRKAALNANLFQPGPSYQGGVCMSYNNELHLAPSNLASTVLPPASGSGPPALQDQHRSPEHLPGAWMCRHCTYINFPNRNVCDICGFTNSGVDSFSVAESSSGKNDLHSRGEFNHWKAGADVVVDAVAVVDPKWDHAAA